MLQPGGIGRVPREITAAVMGFGEDHVVDVGGVYSGAADDLRHDRGDQRLRRC